MREAKDVIMSSISLEASLSERTTSETSSERARVVSCASSKAEVQFTTERALGTPGSESVLTLSLIHI